MQAVVGHLGSLVIGPKRESSKAIIVNLIDLIARKDKLLLVGRDISPSKTSWDGDNWRVVQIKPSTSPQIVIGRIADIYRLRGRPTEIGWFARCSDGDAWVEVALLGEDSVASRRMQIGNHPSPILIPWPTDGRLITGDMRLALSFDMPGGTIVELFVHRMLDRTPLLDLARGDGVEIGPGPGPKIHPSASVNVKYVEEMPAEKWKELYDKSGKRGTAEADWSKYIIGTADQIPADPATLDFIFSSHVFEHLSNPFGHLRRWHDLLKPGGVVLAVVPEMTATKDLTGRPSTMDEIRDEDRAGIWRPTIEHYDKFLRTRRSQADSAQMMAGGKSIHVHYYDQSTIATLLTACVEELGYSAYSLAHSTNHKDFHFVLWKQS